MAGNGSKADGKFGWQADMALTHCYSEIGGRMLSRYSPNLFFLGLNIPLSALYASTAKEGLPVVARVAIIIALIGILVWVVVAKKIENPRADILVVLGSILMWGPILFIYGHVKEVGNLRLYDAAEMVVFCGIGTMFVGVFMGYLAQRKRVREPS